MQPWTSARLEGGSNIAIQQICPGRPVSHAGLLYDAVAFRITVDALANPGPGNSGRLSILTCLQNFAPTVSPLDVTHLTTVVGPLVVGRLALAPQTPAEPALMPYAAG